MSRILVFPLAIILYIGMIAFWIITVIPVYLLTKIKVTFPQFNIKY